jgi:hypothetical protein
MIDYDLLEQAGTTNDRIRQILTATLGDPSKDTPEELDRKSKDVDTRERIEKFIESRLQEHLVSALRSYRLYSAVDLAWDSAPIHQHMIPLLLYAQGRIKMESVKTELKGLDCADEFIKTETGEDGKKREYVDLPKFAEVCINLVRSLITRRVAAQSNKYNNLYPFYSYEPRATTMVGKLRGDLMSERADIMADQFGHRHSLVQSIRDMFLYAKSTPFVRAAWEQDKHWVRKKTVGEGTDITPEVAVYREGVAWVTPHPSRVFWDSAYPLATINTDTGCEYCGFWDVVRYGTIKDNPLYNSNRRSVVQSDNLLSWFHSQPSYFNQYFHNLKLPARSEEIDLAQRNDRVSQVGVYSAEEDDVGCPQTHFFWKLIPSDFGIGDYPYPVWVRFIVGGDRTCVYGEIYPSTPMAYFGYNERDDRVLNVSVAHDLLPYEDMLRNLAAQMLITIKNVFHLVTVDKDLVTEEGVQNLEKAMAGDQFCQAPTVMEVSTEKLKALGFKLEDAVRVVTAAASGNVSEIIRGMGQVLMLAERIMNLSPQEQAQPAPREISATEAGFMEGSTQSIYSFVSDSVDEGRAAQKRIIYESVMSCDSGNVRLPVLSRYPQEVVEKAGFQVAEGDLTETDRHDPESQMTVIGPRSAMAHDFIFTSRDGAERSSNNESAKNLVALLNTLQDPAVRAHLGKRRLFSIYNEIFRLSGSTDLLLELAPGEPDSMDQMTPETASAIQALDQKVSSLAQVLQKLTGGAGPQPQPGPQQPQPMMAQPPA